MGTRLIIQENGLFAIYSTIVDNITVYDATVEELVAQARKDAAEQAEKRIRRWCAESRPGRQHYTPEDAVRWVRACHGDGAAETVRKALAGEEDLPDAVKWGVDDV